MTSFAESHLASVEHTGHQLDVAIESADLTRTYGENTAAHAAETGMTGLYLAASLDVARIADQLLRALRLAKAETNQLAEALRRQGG